MFKTQGFSIVELMVALLLGSIISIAATQLFLVNRQTENLQQGVAEVQDSGRFAMDHVSRDLMQAGHDPDGSIVPFNFDTTQLGYGSDGAKYDRVALKVRDGYDCVGNVNYTGFKQYAISNNKSLECSYWTLDADTGATHKVSTGLIDGVEAFKVRYGLDYDDLGDDSYGIADVYTDADGANTAVTAAGSKVRIVSVRFALLLASQGVVNREPAFAADSIQVLDTTFDTSEDAGGINLQDGRLYRVFSSTVGIRNQMDSL